MKHSESCFSIGRASCPKHVTRRRTTLCGWSRGPPRARVNVALTIWASCKHVRQKASKPHCATSPRSLHRSSAVARAPASCAVALVKVTNERTHKTNLTSQLTKPAPCRLPTADCRLRLPTADCDCRLPTATADRLPLTLTTSCHDDAELGSITTGPWSR